jgi:hypothetical protein
VPFLDKAQSQRPFEQFAIDLLRPVPVEIGDRFESSQARLLEPPLQVARRAVGGLGSGDRLDQLQRRPFLFGRPRDLINGTLLTRGPAENPGCYQQPGFFTSRPDRNANKMLG